MIRLPLTLVVGLLLVAGCGDSLTPRHQIVDLRVLGVRLDPPSAIPGDTVVAQALVVDPSGEGYTRTWYACLAPVSAGSYFAGELDRSACPTGETPHGTSLGQGETPSLVVPDDFMSMVHERVEDSGLDLSEEVVDFLVATTGWYLRLTLVVEGPDKRVEVHKRLVVKPASDQNANPAAPSVVVEEVIEGEPPAVLQETAEVAAPGGCVSPDSTVTAFATDGIYRLTPVNLPNPAPSYTVVDFVGGVQEREETSFYSWFSTAPGLSDPVSKSPDEHPIAFTIARPDTDVLTDGEDGAPAIPIWIVVRDGRGGTAWCADSLPYLESP